MNTEQAMHSALAHHQAGRLAEAEGLYRTVLATVPDHPSALHMLGVLAAQVGRNEVAVDLITKALRRTPDNPGCYSNLGEAYRSLGQLDKAVSNFRRALAIKPDYPEAHNNLGNALKSQGHLDEAIASFERALALKSDYADAHSNLGNALKDQGLLEEAIASYRQALAARPEFLSAHSNLLFALQYSPNYSSAQQLEEARRWNARHVQPLKALVRSPANAPDPERRLRLGYVSPDFCSHATTYGSSYALLANHDHQGFEVFCYSGVPHPDAVTEKLRGFADVWRSTVGRNDGQIAEMIRNDGIDILVDLTMHMAHGHPLVFAVKPAPVQVAWVAYPGTTGIETIDYRLTDPWLDPPGQHDDAYSEQSIRLPDSFWCYEPLVSGPAVNPLPAITSGHVTFGSLNNFCKVNAGVIALWARVLAAVPDSRLLLLSSRGQHREQVLGLFAAHGIDPARIEWFTTGSRPDYFAAYHRIDVGLDTFPYNGHSTSLDSFWMGVPVLTLVGETVVGRAGLCQAMNLDLPELVTRTPGEYVQRAAELARDLPRLATLRASLRGRMQASPLMDGRRFARNVELAYRQMWRNWCARVRR